MFWKVSLPAGFLCVDSLLHTSSRFVRKWHVFLLVYLQPVSFSYLHYFKFWVPMSKLFGQCFSIILEFETSSPLLKICPVHLRWECLGQVIVLFFIYYLPNPNASFWQFMTWNIWALLFCQMIECYICFSNLSKTFKCHLYFLHICIKHLVYP